jgi:hypothetical protein
MVGSRVRGRKGSRPHSFLRRERERKRGGNREEGGE